MNLAEYSMCCSTNVSLRLRFSTRSHCLPLFYLFKFINFSLIPAGEFENSHFIPFNLEVLQSITLIIIRLATIVSLFDTLLTDSIFLTSCIT